MDSIQNSNDWILIHEVKLKCIKHQNTKIFKLDIIQFENYLLERLWYSIEFPSLQYRWLQTFTVLLFFTNFLSIPRIKNILYQNIFVCIKQLILKHFSFWSYTFLFHHKRFFTKRKIDDPQSVFNRVRKANMFNYRLWIWIFTQNNLPLFYIFSITRINEIHLKL